MLANLSWRQSCLKDSGPYLKKCWFSDDCKLTSAPCTQEPIDGLMDGNKVDALS